MTPEQQGAILELLDVLFTSSHPKGAPAPSPSSKQTITFPTQDATLVYEVLEPLLSSQKASKDASSAVDKAKSLFAMKGNLSTDRAVAMLKTLVDTGSLTATVEELNKLYAKVMGSMDKELKNLQSQRTYLDDRLKAQEESQPQMMMASPSGNNTFSNVSAGLGLFSGGRRKSRKLGNTFNRCVKSVRSTVKARNGSTKEAAAIAICTKSVLQTRGKTMKRYRKGRLVTQPRLTRRR